MVKAVRDEMDKATQGLGPASIAAEMHTMRGITARAKRGARDNYQDEINRELTLVAPPYPVLDPSSRAEYGELLSAKLRDGLLAAAGAGYAGNPALDGVKEFGRKWQELMRWARRRQKNGIGARLWRATRRFDGAQRGLLRVTRQLNCAQRGKTAPDVPQVRHTAD